MKNKKSEGFTFHEYEQQAGNTDRGCPTYVDGGSYFMYLSNALVGEAGEFANEVKKHYRDDLARGTAKNRRGGQDTDRKAALVNELGDMLWYMSRLAGMIGFTLGEVAQANIAKLEKRYATPAAANPSQMDGHNA
jgi:NTP pyrophosphatase (non-canonical NTP hydrolase)